MNVVDSSGWLEYFSDGANAGFFANPIEDTDQLIVPTISLYEVFKRVLLERDESDALRAVGFMQLGRVLELTSTIALHAAKLSVEHKIPMADSLMLASSREVDAVLWTQDADFEQIDGIQYVPKS